MEGERLEGRQHKRACDLDPLQGITKSLAFRTLLWRFSLQSSLLHFSSVDRQKLEAPAATSSGPPAARDSSGIFDVLDDLLLKAQEELDHTRLAVLNAAQNFPKIEQSLRDPLAQATSGGEPHW